MSELHATRKAFLDSLSGLTQAQWSYKPGPDRWSIAECAEHIATSEDFLFDVITNKVLKSPASPPQTPPSRDQDEAVLRMVADRGKKFNAPEGLRPSGQWPSREALVQVFKQRRDRSIAFVRETQEDLRAHSQASRDAYQWLLFLSGHTERHIAQIAEVKADRNFPKQ